MIKKHKKYSKPKRPFDKLRIEEENKIIKDYGLKNKKEIWKADAQIQKIRQRAKKLITSTEEEQKKFFEKLKKQGLKVDSIADALALKTENWLNRRLQTLIVKKNIARTPKSARQLITHKHVKVGKNIINVPSYIVPVELENNIKIILKKKKPKKTTEEKVEEISEKTSEPGEKVEEKKNE